jgi:hypothetical protein
MLNTLTHPSLSWQERFFILSTDRIDWYPSISKRCSYFIYPKATLIAFFAQVPRRAPRTG